MGFESSYLGSVNRWECDENDHLNVRFYAEKINQAIRVFLESGGAAPGWRIPSLHIRFVSEARIATPLRVDCAVVSGGGEMLEVLALMRHNLSAAPIAGFLVGVHGAGMREGELPTVDGVPEWAAPRGVDPDDLYPAPAGLREAVSQGFRIMGRGVFGAPECDDAGRLLPQAVMGRISDGMPSLWAFLSEPMAEGESAESTTELGGAVVEYQLEIEDVPCSGDVFRQLSGIRDLGGKTQHMVHLLFNETRATLAARAEAIGVAMDLESRRAVPISDARRQHLNGLMLEPKIG